MHYYFFFDKSHNPKAFNNPYHRLTNLLQYNRYNPRNNIQIYQSSNLLSPIITSGLFYSLMTLHATFLFSLGFNS